MLDRSTRLPISRSQQDVRLSDKRGILPFTRNSLREVLQMTKERRTRKMTVRFTPKEYEKLETKFKTTTSNQVSHYVRNVLLEKPIVIKYRNESLDSFMEELIAMRQELNAIGNNFNQVVKKLHTLRQIPEFREWVNNNEAMQNKFIEQTNHIQQRINQMAERW